MVVTACTAYQPGSFEQRDQPFSGEHHTIGCLDLAVSNRSPIAGPVIGYQFANRCDHVVTVDLATVHVVGKDHSGREIDLVAYDPRHEIVPLPLQARLFADERIEYRGEPVESVCVDVGGIDRDTERRPLWVCP